MKRRAGFRGTRLVAASSQVDRGAEPASRRLAAYWCANDHQTFAAFAIDVELPVEWQCRICSGPCTLERGTAPVAAQSKYSPRTPYEFLLMRRTVEEGERILADALTAMRHGVYPPRDNPMTRRVKE